MEKIEPSPKAHKVMLNYHKTKPNCLVNEIVVKSLELSTIQTFCPRNQHQNSLFSKYVKSRQNTINAFEMLLYQQQSETYYASVCAIGSVLVSMQQQCPRHMFIWSAQKKHQAEKKAPIYSHEMCGFCVEMDGDIHNMFGLFPDLFRL